MSDFVERTIPTDAPSARYRRLLHGCALAVTISVFPLIWMGGLVTTHGAGLSVPDWPNSYGYNMFLFPPSQWLGGIFYEHTHRLLGTLSGFLSIALALLAWGPARSPGRRRIIGIFAAAMWLSLVLAVGCLVLLNAVGQDSAAFNRQFSHVLVLFASLGLVATIARFCTARDERRWVRWLTVAQLLAIIVQGTLGGLRVELINLHLAMVHACFAQLFFTASAVTALVFSKWWRNAGDRAADATSPAGRWAMRIAATCLLVTFAQLVAGATMRHNQAGLAIPDLPWAYGKLIPPTDATELEAANQTRIWTHHLPATTLEGIWLHYSHRVGALLVSAFVLAYAGMVLSKLMRTDRAASVTAVILTALVSTQFTLGVLTVYWQKPADIASLHVAVGALTLMAAGVSVAVTARQYARRRAPATVAGARGNEFSQQQFATV